MIDPTLILIGFLAPIIWAWTNIIDQFLVNKRQISNLTLLFFAGIGMSIFAVIFQFHEIRWPSLDLIIWSFVISLFRIAYIYPYYQALKIENTSIVAALFFVGDAFLPIFAHFLLGETLAPGQYAGFFLIIFSAGFISLRGIRFNIKQSAAFYMGIGMLFYIARSLSRKYLVEEYPWSDVFIWSSIMIGLVSFPIIFKKKYFHEIVYCLKPKNKVILPLCGERLIAFLGTGIAFYVLSELPLTVAKGIESTQPFFVLLFAVLLASKAKTLFFEDRSKSEVIKKLLSFTVMLIGILLVVGL